MTTTHGSPNKLINEKSPYLLQHAYNPVDWYPWGEEAFEKAKRENKPIFLSIGYSTCHWCHVLAHESFEDEETAEFLNKHFVSIKVDREERPDIDSVYMTVCQAFTGQGGWPLSIFMTPEQKPFYAGTYFPKKARYGLPSFKDILAVIAHRWDKEEIMLRSTSDKVMEDLDKFFVAKAQEVPLKMDVLKMGYRELEESFDETYGGFGREPKFPTGHRLMFLLRYYALTKEEKALEMVEKTLQQMYRGGIFDHIGGGFSRYSVDKKWLVPHFEKMLYDNALLITVYLEAYEITKKELYKRVAEEAIGYVFKSLRAPQGGFYCAEDADTEGEEGKYYLFTPDELIELLGEEKVSFFNQYYDITEKGNFEGRNIPNLLKNEAYDETSEEMNSLKEKIQEYRSNRFKLHKDDKLLTSWNGLMIAALGKAYRVLGDEIYLKEASKAVDFIFNNMVNEKGGLLARYREGESRFNGYLEDYAFLTHGLIELYEASFEIDYLEKALTLTEKMIEGFKDTKGGGYYIYSNKGESLIARPKELYDGAMPSGNSVAAYNLIRLARLTGREELEAEADKQLSYITGAKEGYEMNYTFYLVAAAFALSEPLDLVAVIKSSEDRIQLLEFLREKPSFNLLTIVKDEKNSKELEKLAPFTTEYAPLEDTAAYYLCKNRVCSLPVSSLEDLTF